MWPFLLEVFDHASTYAQRQHQHYLMTSQYQQLLLQCQVCAAHALVGVGGLVGRQRAQAYVAIVCEL